MSGEHVGLEAILAAAEAAAPMESIGVVGEDLKRRFGADSISFLFVDLVGDALVRLAGNRRTESGREAECIGLSGSVYDRVLRTQRLYRTSGGEGGQRVIVPVTNRGDRIGVLELTLPDATDQVLREVLHAAHALAYLIVTDGRFTDFYHWGRRTTQMSLAAEIQYQLLPGAPSCETPQFTIAATLIPADTVGGDTYDYAVDQDTLHVSITDAMGHDVESALMAALMVGALRGARRSGHDIVEQAHWADQALLEHGNGAIVTGQLLRIDLRDGGCQVINAGHPWPLCLRDGKVQEVSLVPEPPFGISADPYHVQSLDLRGGDRLILLTDGMQPRDVPDLDLPALVHETRDLHPRETVQTLTNAVRTAFDNQVPDDATVVCLDWYGTGSTSRRVATGADISHASPVPVAGEPDS